MIEKIHFGNPVWGYMLLAIILGSGIVLTSLFCRWFYTLFIPSKGILKKRNRVLLFLLISWPLLIVGCSIWAAYKIGYSHFYSLRIEPSKGVVAEYLWPKDKVSIPGSEIATILLVHKGRGWKGSDILVITTKSGQRLRSTAPVPDPEVLPDRIRVALEIPTEECEKEIYIPKDLEDCFAELEKILKPEDIKKMKEGTENDIIQYHFGLGMWIRNNWGLWGESHLAKWFNAQGIKHPDDMSSIILNSFWRHLNSKPIKLNEQVKYYQDYWKKIEVK